VRYRLLITRRLSNRRQLVLRNQSLDSLVVALALVAGGMGVFALVSKPSNRLLGRRS
jgi:hypothetical protein